MNDTVNVEGYGWTKSVHAEMTEKQFVDLYMNEDHGHIYPYMKPEQKRATLKLAYKACEAKPPKAEK